MLVYFRALTLAFAKLTVFLLSVALRGRKARNRVPPEYARACRHCLVCSNSAHKSTFRGRLSKKNHQARMPNALPPMQCPQVRWRYTETTCQWRASKAARLRHGPQVSDDRRRGASELEEADAADGGDSGHGRAYLEKLLAEGAEDRHPDHVQGADEGRLVGCGRLQPHRLAKVAEADPAADLEPALARL
eukprot:6193766-Pleurochrysis_carterae.AAC.1